ncbi:response regulator [Providencia alcalifaciens]|uniref:response regulator transcription factor n=1 Tax=Providencia TaxID=586 RepID=UPI0012B5198B|nr:MULTISPECIES: response regulator transcription factor [Providencia]MTC48239.1 response regulator [Providencia alcalifaciens]
MKKLTLVLVDDHPIVLSGLKKTLSQSLHFSIEGEFTNDSDLFAFLKSHTVDVIVTDYMMPNNTQSSDGQNYIQFLRRKYPNIALVVLTMISNPMIIQTLYDNNVNTVVSKEAPLPELIKAITLAGQGKQYRQPIVDLTTTMKSRNASTLDERVKTLSPRELEVLRLFVQGKPIVEIAKLLNRSDKTISLQKNAAMRKLRVENNQALISYCITHHLFD